MAANKTERCTFFRSRADVTGGPTFREVSEVIHGLFACLLFTVNYSLRFREIFLVFIQLDITRLYAVHTIINHSIIFYLLPT